MFENLLRKLAGMGDEMTVQVPVSHDAGGSQRHLGRVAGQQARQPPLIV